MRLLYYILSNFDILSSISGCVENTLLNFFFNGSDMNSGATAFGNLCLSLGERCSFFIFLNADVSPGGYLVSLTPVASAANSLFLDIANDTKFANNGAKIDNAIPITIKNICALPSLFLFPEENHRLLKNISAIIAIMPMTIAVNVMNL